MKLKMTYTQFMCLYNLFLVVVLEDRDSRSIADKLPHLLMLKVYQKLYVMAVKKEASYRIKLEHHEALAFWLYWQGHTFPNTSLEGNLLNQIISKIDQQYA